MYQHYQILWLFGLLIIGSQLILKTNAAEALPNCSNTYEDDCGDETDPSSSDYFCIKDNIIYRLASKDANDCISKIESGMNIFDISKDQENVYTIQLINDETESITAANLVIYSCSTTCTRMYGYILINNSYYSVGITESTSVGTIATTSCTADNIGTLYKDEENNDSIKLCLANGIGSQAIDTTGTISNYVMINKSGNIFTGDTINTEKYIGINAAEKVILYYKIADGSYSVNNESGQILGTLTEKATDPNWDMIYNCSNGLCEGNSYCNLNDRSSYSGCTEGYYITSGTGKTILATVAATGDLYQCVNNSGITCSTVEDTDIPKGYLVNIDPISNASIPYIKCNGSTCSSLALSSLPTACNSSGVKIGDLIATTSNGYPTYSVCLSTASAGGVQITSTNEGKQYFIDIHTNENNPFGYNTGTTDYGIIQIDESGNVLLQEISVGYYIGSSSFEVVTSANIEGTLYNCPTADEVVCNQVASSNIQLGYYINTGNTDDEGHYIKCSKEQSSKICKTIKIEKSSCGGTGGATTGELIRETNPSVKYSLCIDSTATTPVSIELDSTAASVDKYIISIDGNGNVFGNEDKKFAIISVDKQNINLSCNDAAGYYIVDSSYKWLSAAGTGTLYNCVGTTSITCESVTDVGFYKNVDPTVQYSKCYYTTADPAVFTCEGLSTLPTDECNAADINGKITKTGLCLNGSKEAAFVDADAASDTPEQYMVEYGENSIFANSVLANTYGVIKVTKTSMILDTSYTNNKEVCVDGDQKVSDLPDSGSCTSGSTLYSLCSSGICQKICKVKTGVNCEDKTYYLVSNADSSIPITDNETTGLLYYCTDPEGTGTISCTEKTDKGYYVNDKDNAFSCSGGTGTCKKETVLTDGCITDNIGKLFYATDVKLCLNYDGENAISKVVQGTTPDNGNFLLSFGTGNLFGITSGKMGLIKIIDQSVTLLNSNGNCIESLTAANRNTIAGDGVAGTLYTCTSGLCSTVADNDIKIGYYRNIGSSAVGTSDYIKCEGTETTSTVNGSTVTTITKTCKGLSVGTAADCTSKTIGDLIYETTGTGASAVTTYKICLTTSIPIALGSSGTNDGQYFISVDADNIVFGKKADHFVIIRVAGDSVFLEVKETGINLYRYGESTTQKLIKDNKYDSSKCSGTPLTATVLEFPLDDVESELTNYYTQTS